MLLRALLALALGTLCFMLIAASDAEATPMKVDLQKIVRQAQKPPIPYAPARAGWDGPKAKKDPSAGIIADFNQLMDQATLARRMREELTAIAIPDPRVLIGLAAVILLLRKWRQMHVPAIQPQPA